MLTSILLIVMLIEFILFCFLGVYGFLMALLLFVFPLIFLHYREKLYKNHSKELQKKQHFQHFFIMLAIAVSPIFVSEPLTQFVINSQRYESIKNDFNKEDYRVVINSVRSDKSYGYSYYRANRLKEKAIHAWITECQRVDDIQCQEEIFNIAFLDDDLKSAATKAFGYSDEKQIEKLHLENLSFEEKVRKKAESSTEPYVGMETQYVGLTGWGPPDEEVVTSDTTGNSMLRSSHRNKWVTYHWYVCKDNKQYSFSVDALNGEVRYISGNSRGIEVSNIHSNFQKCNFE